MHETLSSRILTVPSPYHDFSVGDLRCRQITLSFGCHNALRLRTGGRSQRQGSEGERFKYVPTVLQQKVVSLEKEESCHVEEL